MSSTKKQTNQLRQPYYGLSDSIFELKDAADLQADDKLEKIMNELQEKADELQAHLNANYIWD